MRAQHVNKEKFKPPPQCFDVTPLSNYSYLLIGILREVYHTMNSIYELSTIFFLDIYNLPFYNFHYILLQLYLFFLNEPFVTARFE